MHDIANFFRGHAPFDSLDNEALEKLATSVDIEFFAAGARIIDSGDETARFGYVVRTGSVELMLDGRLVDLAGDGEMFGFAPLLSEDPGGLMAVAAEDTLVYRIPADVLRPVLERPAFVRFVTQVMTKRLRMLAGRDPEPPLFSGGRPVGELIRAAALVCGPSMSVQEAAKRMAEAGVTCIVVDTGNGLGIVTDRDIRTRVVAAGAAPETAVSEVMTAPAWTVSSDRMATEALLEMIAHGIRHLPVLSPDRRLLGVLDDVDLLANERRAPFRLRAAIARASDAGEAAEAAAELPEMVIALFDAGLPPAAISRAISSIHDAVTRRLIEFAQERLGRPAAPYTWLARAVSGASSHSRAPMWTARSRGRDRTTWSCGARWSRARNMCWRTWRRAASHRTRTGWSPRIPCSPVRSRNGNTLPRRGSSNRIATAGSCSCPSSSKAIRSGERRGRRSISRGCSRALRIAA